MRLIVIEKDYGGLQIEHYDDGEIITVVANLEFAKKGSGIEDLKNYHRPWNQRWSFDDMITAYNNNHNTAHYISSPSGEEMTAVDVVDRSLRSNVVATYDGEKLTLRPDVMGPAAKYYFGVE